jgi:AraC-like DNA-binding protein
MQSSDDKKAAIAVNFKLILIFTAIILVLLFGIVLFQIERNTAINFQNQKINTYGDHADQGNSEALSLTKTSTGMRFLYIIRKGFAYPYAGVSISLQDSSGNFFDCTDYKALRITVASSQLSDCKLYLNVFDKKFSKNSDPLSVRHLYRGLLLSPVPTTYVIPLNQFITPEWWYQKNNITLKDVTQIDFSKVISLKIESGPTAKTGVIDTLTISEISLIKKNNTAAILILIFLIASIMGYGIKKLGLFKRKEKKKQSPVIITYEKKDMHSYKDIDAQRIASHIAEHFFEPDLSILTVGTALGLSQKKIAKVMNEVFKMSFKQYITSIRIHEAKRLLKKTDRLVIDIALEVGFSSISHFNRVFKTIELISPVEFRKKLST